MKTSISIVDSAGPKVPFVLRGNYYESIKLAKSIGYDAIELHVRDPKNVDAAKIINVCDHEKIAVSSIGTGLSYAIDGLSLMSKDDDIRHKAVLRLKDFISLAESLNAVVIIGLMKGIIQPDENYSTCETRVIDSIMQCMGLAEAKKVIVVLEAINRYESNFLTNIDETLLFVQKFHSDFLKVHIDTFHMNIEEASFKDSIIKCGNLLGHVHVADNDRMYPGHGHIQFGEVLETLDKSRYKGYIAVECLSLPEPFEAATKALSYMRSL